MDLEVSELPVKDGTRRILQLRGMPYGDVEAYLDSIGDIKPAPLTLLDGFVHAAFFPAMTVGGELRVHGPVSRQALINLMELQDAWLSYRTGLYRPVTIIPDKIVDAVPQTRPLAALTTFSGGVDSIFTLMRHFRDLNDPIHVPIEGALFFDRVRVDGATRNGKLLDRIRALLDERNVPLAIVRTNLESIPDANFNYSFASHLSAYLHCYADRFSHGIIGSSEPYRSPIVPWGSSLLDKLYSSGMMTVVHYGAAFSRTEKAALIAESATALRVLHVCPHASPVNCGRCAKCVRTKLNFIAVGVAAPPCMPGPLELEEIDRLDIFSTIELNELKLIVQYAEEKGLSGAWLDRLRQRLARYKPATRWTILRKEWPLAVNRRLKLLGKLARSGQTSGLRRRTIKPAIGAPLAPRDTGPTK